MNDNPCEYDGTCDDAEPTIAEYCAANPETPFCSGDSMQECADGTEVSEDETCVVSETAEPVQIEVLPVTGVNDVLLVGAMGILAVGTAIIRFIKS